MMFITHNLSLSHTLPIQHFYSHQVLEAEQKKKKAHEASAIGKLQAFGHNVGKLVGTAESESEPESDVSTFCKCFSSVFFCLFCGTTVQSVREAGSVYRAS